MALSGHATARGDSLIGTGNVGGFALQPAYIADFFRPTRDSTSGSLISRSVVEDDGFAYMYVIP